MFPTSSPYSADKREKIIRILNQRIANLFDLYSQAKNAHWNCKGINFYQQHLLFDRIAGEIYDKIDPLAERLTSMGGVVFGTVNDSSSFSTLPIQLKTLISVKGFTLDIKNKVAEEYANVVTDTVELLSLGDNSTANKMSDIEDMLSTHLYLLESSLITDN